MWFRVLMRHELGHELGIAGIVGDLGRDDSVDVHRGNAVPGIFDQDVRMRESSLLEFNRVDAVRSGANVRKHCV